MKIIFVVLTNILLFACVNNNRTDAPELLDKILDKQILIKNTSGMENISRKVLSLHLQ